MAAVPSIGRAATVASATDATERLYDRHHRKVYAFCLYQLGNRDDAAEASQTTFMQALTALQRGVDPTFELPWLIAIARNVCRTRWDAGKRRRRIELARDPYDLASIAPARETTELVGIQDALAALPEPQRRALVLREWHGLSYQEIADELGLTLPAVETLIFRGRRSLARELGADEKGKRSLGIGSLLGSVKSVAGGGLTAKVAVGVVAAVGIGVAANQELARHRPSGRRVPVEAGRTQPATPAGTRATSATASAARRLSGAGRPLVHSKLKVATAALGSHRRAPAAPPALVPAAGTPAPGTPAPTSSAPASPAGTVAPPVASAPGAPAPPRATTRPATVPAPVTDAVQPVAATSAHVGGTVAGAADPVVAKATDTVGQVVTTATDAAAPVVATVTNAAAPVVATVTNTATPVVTTVTNATAPVVPTVTNVLPPLPAPVQAPPVKLPPVHLP